MTNKIKLIATDMDGTLLNSKGQLPEDFYETFERLKEAGVLFAAASGRQYFTLIENFKQIADDMVFIAENGTYVARKGEILAVHPLEVVLAHELIKVGRTIKEAYIVLATSSGAYIESEDERFVREVNKYYVKCKVVKDLLSVDDEILKVTICDFSGAENNSYKIYEKYKSKTQMSVAGDIWLDIMSKGINKGIAIEDIQKSLGVLPEETMVFGDYLNDYEMLDKAYYSCAMANAHPLLKEKARFIAKSNDENGVMDKIKEVVFKDYEKK